MSGIKSTREVADFVGVQEWRIRRLFEDGTLPEPARFAGRRVISPDLVPAIVDALRARGWLREPTFASSCRLAIDDSVHCRPDSDLDESEGQR